MKPRNHNLTRLEWRSPDVLETFDNKVRKHPASQIRKLVQSIKTNGCISPLLINKHNQIIAGEARLIAARELNLTSVPVLQIEHLSAEEERALRIADNRIAEDASWIEDGLQIEIVELETAGIDLSTTGLEIGEIDPITGATEPHEDEEEVAAPVREGPSISHVGDQFVIGDHRIVCGDALKSTTYDALLNGASVHAVFADAPYNVGISGHVSGTGRHAEFVQASGNMTTAEFGGFLEEFLRQVIAVMAPGATGFAAMDWRSIALLLQKAEEVGYDLANLCVWVKSNPGMGSLYRSQHEMFSVLRKPGGQPVNNVQLGKFGRNRSNVWSYPGASSIGSEARKDLSDHPTPKPVALVADVILDVTGPGDLVLDPFGGGGATLIAAQRTGRFARMIELDPYYVDAMIRRAQKTFGLTAYCARTGRSFDELTALRERARNVRQRERGTPRSRGGSR